MANPIPDSMHRVRNRMYDLAMSSSRLLFQDDGSTPLGALSLAGIDIGSRGVSSRPMRVLGSYALVLLLEGGGRFQDALGTRGRVAAGDVLLLFPEVPHAYGPLSGSRAPKRWDEIYFVFKGPIFDELRAAGLLSPTHPILRPSPEWRERIQEFGHQHHAPARVIDLLRFATLVSELAEENVPASETGWVELAERFLGRDLERSLDMGAVAAALDMAPDAFRKRFAREKGITPSRYRAAQRITAAEALLRGTRMPLRAIAASLGFTDEFHLSRRFKESRGVSPSECRRRNAEG
ncbi:AraC family transcriptional regulator [bacterium]|nr:MAG: AraC family transcriptional regulator [bacterium]